LAATTTWAGDWVVFRSGPFEVATDGDQKQARQIMNHLEQLRHVLGQTLNAPELKLLWPVRVTAAKTFSDLVLDGDAYRATFAKGPVPAQWNRTLAEAFLREGVNRMPAHLERGLVEFFTLLQIDEVKVIGGAVPANAGSRDWARVHMLMTSDEYYGRSRSFFFNMQQGMTHEVAYRNSLGRTEAEIEKQLDAWTPTKTVRLNARPVNLERDFYARPWDPAKGSPTGAMAAFDRGDFEGALRAKPDWPAAKFRLALQTKDSLRKLTLLKDAAEGARREAPYWRALAEEQMAAHQYADAGKSWSYAERAAANDAERQQLRDARAAIEERRVAYELAEKQRKKEEAEAELNRLRNDALGDIRRAEAKANEKLASQNGYDANAAKPVAWDSLKQAEAAKPAAAKPVPAPASGTVKGVLESVTCEGLRKTLVVRGKDTTPLKIQVPAGQVNYRCGLQPKPREVTVKYVPLKPARQGILGEAADVEFAAEPE